jgi:nucleoredoxin
MSFDARSLFPGVTALLKNGCDDVPIAHLSSAEVIGIYFSAQRCSREFTPLLSKTTPVLSKTFNEIKAAGKRFEIVFVSSDGDEASIMPCALTLPICRGCA